MSDWRVNETPKRSLLKAVSYRIIEITATSLVLHFWFNQKWPTAIGAAVLLETICLLLHFLFERIWNRIEYGREILSLDRGMAQSLSGKTVKRK